MTDFSPKKLWKPELNGKKIFKGLKDKTVNINAGKISSKNERKLRLFRQTKIERIHQQQSFITRKVIKNVFLFSFFLNSLHAEHGPQTHTLRSRVSGSTRCASQVPLKILQVEGKWYKLEMWLYGNAWKALKW